MKHEVRVMQGQGSGSIINISSTYGHEGAGGGLSGVPLVFNMHFTGTMDHWDPLVTDGLAATREVILFNNAGISGTSGEVPASVEEMAANAAAFIKALEMTKVDLLGFSIGGFVAQEITLQAPDLVRRLLLIGTGPRGGEGMASHTPEAQRIFSATYDPPDELWLSVHFTHSETSRLPAASFSSGSSGAPRTAILR
jgi:pimeloyl-ACP methyl ester carboxylesterase